MEPRGIEPLTSWLRVPSALPCDLLPDKTYGISEGILVASWWGLRNPALGPDVDGMAMSISQASPQSPFRSAAGPVTPPAEA